MPPITAVNDCPLSTLCVETEMLLYGPGTTGSDPGTRSGLCSGQGPASSHSEPALAWGSASWSYRDGNFCDFIASLIMLFDLLILQ